MTAIRELLDGEADAIDLFEHVHGLNDVEKQAFRVLAESDRRLTIDQVNEEVECERSTTYRAVQHLCRIGFVEKSQHNYENGGYCHVYGIADVDAVADETLRTVNDLYALLDRLIDECRNAYAPPATDAEVERRSQVEGRPG